MKVGRRAQIPHFVRPYVAVIISQCVKPMAQDRSHIPCRNLKLGLFLFEIILHIIITLTTTENRLSQRRESQQNLTTDLAPLSQTFYALAQNYVVPRTTIGRLKSWKSWRDT